MRKYTFNYELKGRGPLFSREVKIITRVESIEQVAEAFKRFLSGVGFQDSAISRVFNEEDDDVPF